MLTFIRTLSLKLIVLSSIIFFPLEEGRARSYESNMEFNPKNKMATKSVTPIINHVDLNAPNRQEYVEYVSVDGNNFNILGSKIRDNVVQFNYISGTDQDDSVVFRQEWGINIGIVDLLGGDNSVTIPAIIESINTINSSNGTNIDFYNVSTFFIDQTTNINAILNATANDGITIHFRSVNNSPAGASALLKGLNLIGGSRDSINVTSGMLVDIKGDATLAANYNIISLDDASSSPTMNSLIKIDGKFLIYGGDNTITVGRYANFSATQGFYFGGYNSIIMKDNSSMNGDINFGNGNNVIMLGKDSTIHGNIAFGNGNNSVTTDKSTIGVPRTTHNIGLGNGNNVINLKNDSYIYANISFGKGNNSILSNFSAIHGNVTAGNGDNTIELNNYATIRGNVNLGHGNNTITLNRGSSGASIIGSEDHNLHDGNVTAGNGNNVIKVEGNSIIQGNVNLGDGNNKLTTNFSTIRGNISFGDGNNTLILSNYSWAEGSIAFGDGNNIFIASIPHSNDNITSVKDSITFGKGSNTFTVEDSVNFSAGHLSFHGNNSQIIIGNGSKFEGNEKGENKVTLHGNYNTVELGTGSTTNRNFSFLGNNNKVTVNTGTKEQITTLNGSLLTTDKNDVLTVKGKGNFLINSTNNPNAIAMNNIDLGYASIGVSSNVNATINASNLAVTVHTNPADDINSRIVLNNIGEGKITFANNELNLKYRGFTRALSKVGQTYDLNLITVTNGTLDQLSDIGLNKINSQQSVIYRFDKAINNNTVNLNITKCSTFVDALSGKDLCATGETDVSHGEVIQVADYLDKVVDKLAESNAKDMSQQEFHDLLDNLYAMNLSELNDTLQKGMVPIINTALFNINKNLVDNFNNITLEHKVHKASKDNISIWYDYNYSKLQLDNLERVTGASANGNLLSAGIEYTINDFITLGTNFGYARLGIKGNQDAYTGHSNNIYYGIYGIGNITNNLTLNINTGILSSSYDLSRSFAGNDIVSKPKLSQANVDAVLAYKIEVSSVTLSPFASFGYHYGVAEKHTEKGLMAYSVEKGNFNEVSGGFGIKAVMPTKVGTSTIIPNITLAVNATSQDVDSTTVNFDKFADLSNTMEFGSSDNYGGVVGVGNVGVSYVFSNGLALGVNVGTNLGSKIKSYNTSISFNLPL